MQFYQHSGRCGTWGIPLAAGAGILAGLVLGCIYAFVINWIPIIYVSFLATAGFGFGVGAAVAWGAKTGKMRSMFFATVVAAVVGLIAVYVAWVFDPMARAGVAGPVWSMEMLWEYIKLGYEQGFWSIGQNGGAVTGPFLAAVWIAEAALIVGLAVFAVRSLLGNHPFCEETNQWTKAQKDVAQVSLTGDEQSESKLERLMNGDLYVLAEFFRASPGDPALLRLDLATCDECPACKFLTVVMIQHVVDKKGEVTKQENKLLVNLQVASEDLDLIRNAGQERSQEPEREQVVEASPELAPGH